MADLVFRRTRGQRGYDLGLLAFFAFFAVFGIVWAQLRRGEHRVVWLAAAGVSVCIVVIVPVMRGQTVVGSDRLQAVRPLRRHSWRWEEIATIDVRVVRGRYVSRWVKVTTTGGRSFTLPAPYDFSLAGDPDFDKHVAAIRDRWDQATGRGRE